MDVRYANTLENEAKMGECEIKKNKEKMKKKDLLKKTIEVAKKYERAGRYYEKIPYPFHAGICNSKNKEIIGDYHFYKREYQKALEYYVQALFTIEEINQPETLDILIGSVILNYKMAESFLFLNRIDNAKELYEVVLNNCSTIKTKFALAEVPNYHRSSLFNLNNYIKKTEIKLMSITSGISICYDVWDPTAAEGKGDWTTDIDNTTLIRCDPCPGCKKSIKEIEQEDMSPLKGYWILLKVKNHTDRTVRGLRIEFSLDSRYLVDWAFTRRNNNIDYDIVQIYTPEPDGEDKKRYKLGFKDSNIQPHKGKLEGKGYYFRVISNGDLGICQSVRCDKIQIFFNTNIKSPSKRKRYVEGLKGKGIYFSFYCNEQGLGLLKNGTLDSMYRKAIEINVLYAKCPADNKYSVSGFSDWNVARTIEFFKECLAGYIRYYARVGFDEIFANTLRDGTVTRILKIQFDQNPDDDTNHSENCSFTFNWAFVHEDTHILELEANEIMKKIHKQMVCNISFMGLPP
jgi:hypothetical protein